MKKSALITGITGQDGSYLAELLLNKGYVVHGIKRRVSSFNTERIDHLIPNPNFSLHYGDLTDSSNLIRLVKILSQMKYIILELNLMLRLVLTVQNTHQMLML